MQIGLVDQPVFETRLSFQEQSANGQFWSLEVPSEVSDKKKKQKTNKKATWNSGEQQKIEQKKCPPSQSFIISPDIQNF